jgi:hypothetical protein
LPDARLDLLLVAGAVDNRRVLAFDPHAPRAAQHVETHLVERDAELLRDDLAAGHDRYILEHRLAAIAETGCLDRRDPEPAAQAIDHQSGEHLALHVLGNDDERATRLHDLFEKRQQGLQAR